MRRYSFSSECFGVTHCANVLPSDLDNRVLQEHVTFGERAAKRRCQGVEEEGPSARAEAKFIRQLTGGPQAAAPWQETHCSVVAWTLGIRNVAEGSQSRSGAAKHRLPNSSHEGLQAGKPPQQELQELCLVSLPSGNACRTLHFLFLKTREVAECPRCGIFKLS